MSSYSFADHRKTVQMRLLDVKSGQSTLLFQNPAYSEPTWIGETEFLLLKSGDRGCTYLMLADASKPGSELVVPSSFLPLARPHSKHSYRPTY